MGHLTFLEMQGEAYERGRQYGAGAKVKIQQNVEAYLRLIEFHAGLGREAALRAASAFEPFVKAHAPDLLLEMHGIASGAACDPLEVLLINSRSELLSAPNECTALAVAPEVTEQGHTLLGQNWDWYTAVESDPVLLRIRQPGKPEILTLVEAGQVGKIGLNSAGLGVCLNFLEHVDQGLGVPVHIILRQMLNCETQGEAIQAACDVPRGGAANILLAHAEGEMVALELTARDADYLYGDAGWLMHTNHFESVRLRGGDTGVAGSMSTLDRAARARRLLASTRGRISLENLRAILSDHAGGAYAICRHADPSESALQQSATRASVLMDLSERTMHLAPGQPCRQDYRSISFASR